MPADPGLVEVQRRLLVNDIPPVIGHRGAALHAPENTLAGVRAARALGVRWVEVDVRLSGDGVLYLLHDDTLDRTTDGSGSAKGRAIAELASLDAGGWFDPGYAGERLPTLDALFDLLIARDMAVNLEIKPNQGEDAATARVLCHAIRARWPKSRRPPLISSFSRGSLAIACDVAPELPRGLLVESPGPDVLEIAAEFGCATIHANAVHCSSEWLHAMELRKIPVLCFTVNDGAEGKRLLDAGAHSIISDAPERIIAALLGQSLPGQSPPG